MKIFWLIRVSPILLSSFLSCLMCQFVLAHEDEPETNTEKSATGFTTHVEIDARRLNATSTNSAALPLVGIGQLRQPDWLFGGSGVGLGWAGVVKSVPTDAEMAYTYSDQEKKWLVDHARIGVDATNNVHVDIGRMNPLPAKQPESWGVPNLLMQSVLADDHWHADGIKATLSSRKSAGDTITAGVYFNHDKHVAYLGGQEGLGLVSVGVNHGFTLLNKPLQLSGAVAYVPDFNRVVLPLVKDSAVVQSHTHTTDVSACGRTLTCFKGSATLVWLGATLQFLPNTQTALYAMQRYERGNISSSNGKAQDHTHLDGLVWDVSHKFTAYPVTLAARGEWLTITHRVTGVNATLLAHDAGVHDNTGVPNRLVVRATVDLPFKKTYSLLPQVYGVVMRDDSREAYQKAEMVYLVGVKLQH